MSGGLVIRNSRKDYIAEKTFFGVAYRVPEEIRPLGRIEEIKASPLVDTPVFQGFIPSCVSCSCTWLNMWNSWKNSQNPTHLSWPFLYASVEHFNGGTIPQQGLDVLRKIGQPEDKILPQKKFIDNPDLAEMAPKPEEFMGAEDFKISSYFFFKKPTIANIYPYLKESPIIIGINVGRDTWAPDIIIAPGRTDFQHAVCLVDVDNDGNLIVISWDREDGLDVRILRKDYPILMAAMIRDLPDGVAPANVRRGFSLSSIINSFKSFLL